MPLRLPSSRNIVVAFVVVAAAACLAVAGADPTAAPLQSVDQGGDPIFGTKNGYDVGGTDPMCWSSQFRGIAVDAKHQTGQTNDIEQLNELTFGSTTTTIGGSSNNTSAAAGDNGIELDLGQLMPECYPGIAMSIQPVSSLLSQMTMGEDFTFALTLQADLTRIAVLAERLAIRDQNKTASPVPPSIGSLIGPKSTIHVRLQLCDALQQGFCNPIRDTRAKDAALSRDQTDLAPPATSSELSDPSSFQFPDGTNKWNYKQGDVLFGIPDRTTVSARWCKWALQPQNNRTDDTIYQAAFNITIRLPDKIREGAYFFVAHAVMNFQVDDDLERVDVAKTLPGNVVEVRRPPTILRLTRSMELGVITTMAVFGATALAIFAATVYHRNHQVMKISQGSLLSALSLVATLQIAALYTILPLSDLSCHINDFAELVPMTMLGSLLVGRMWRVYTTLSSANTLGRLTNKRDQSGCDGRKSCCSFSDSMIAVLGYFADLPFRCRQGSGRRSSLAGLRRTVTLQQTCSLIFFLTLPQLIYQVLVIVLSKRSLEIELDSDKGIGRKVCSDRAARKGGVAIAVVVYLVALWIASLSRHLPSAFNEKEHIFLVSITTATLALVTVSLLGITDVPSSSPDVQVFLEVVLFLGVAMSTLLLVVWPKLQRVFSGEQVVMSKLLDSRFSVSKPHTFAESFASTVINDDEQNKGEQNKGEKKVVVSFSHRRKAISLNEPLPTNIEQDILGVQNLLRDVSTKFESGKPLTKDDWKSMRSLIHDFNFDLGSVDVFDEGEELNTRLSTMTEC